MSKNIVETSEEKQGSILGVQSFQTDQDEIETAFCNALYGDKDKK